MIGLHIPALFLVPTLLVASMPFAATQPWARWTAPIVAWLLATGRDPSGATGTGDQGIGILVGAGWLIAAAMVSAVVVMRRDIA
ncbi:hypothetical protein ASF48_06170 [Rathayibacter sp. Leaf299]|uniref:hypothetical protein n=1 Tax=Rathayibacter sp. Leaf299 TaxID=1736328 RepID=UPI0006F72E49|nr:hypothetical protein [Rathayibacter sp. Leaf299]KQQ22746.1 hypothetical protein ASF48_06170 [Rathayibacter sp. Leaf299]